MGWFARQAKYAKGATNTTTSPNTQALNTNLIMDPINFILLVAYLFKCLINLISPEDPISGITSYLFQDADLHQLFNIPFRACVCGPQFALKLANSQHRARKKKIERLFHAFWIRLFLCNLLIFGAQSFQLCQPTDTVLLVSADPSQDKPHPFLPC